MNLRNTCVSNGGKCFLISACFFLTVIQAFGMCETVDLIFNLRYSLACNIFDKQMVCFLLYCIVAQCCNAAPAVHVKTDLRCQKNDAKVSLQHQELWQQLPLCPDVARRLNPLGLLQKKVMVFIYLLLKRTLNVYKL